MIHVFNSALPDISSRSEMLIDKLNVNPIPMEIIGTQNDHAQMAAFNYQKKWG